MGIEYERKFKLNDPTFFALAAAFCRDAKTIQMETTYYDTPSGALSSRHYTLRLRLENGKSVCTLKTPAGEARNEWETENTSIEDAIPQLIAQGAPAELQELAKEGLSPICGAKFTRLAKIIPITEGELEMALDYGKLFAGDREVPLCELELELKSGNKKSFDLFVWSVAGEYLLEEETDSKFCRAFRLYKGE
ncbi:MAG: CYTH domain-containing protein [Oscillospiraceae bacterium]|nr:CYTH domain-containing protein [Oscillospiraceae bacterium]